MLGSWVDNRIQAVLATDGARGREQLRAEFRQALVETVDGVAANLATFEERLKVAPGKLPMAKVWCPEAVTYEGQLVSYSGGLYQATKDTAQTPGGSDWLCVARAGRDGQSVTVRGAFDAREKYQRFDIIEHDGSSFIVRRDAPGVPGISDGWQLMSRAGRRGATGETGETGPRGRKGEHGARGEDALEIVGWHLERETYRAFPVLTGRRRGPS